MMKRLVFLFLLVSSVTTDALAETASITYVTSKTFYVDAGASAGIAPGAVVELLRDGTVLGTARVREVTASRAICEWTDPQLTPQLGDQIRFEPVQVEPVAPGGQSGSWFDGVGLHGRIGLQSLHVRDRSGYGSDFDRPSLTLRLTGQHLGGTAIGTEVDVRAATLRQSGSGETNTESHSRVYRLNFFGGDPASGWSWAAGRQFAPSLSVVHLFDGLRAQYARGNWSTGLLGGLRPDPDLALSGDAMEGGGWVTYARRSGETRWAATTALVGAWDGGEVDREFMWLQARWAHRSLTLRADQVLDLNRGWKKDAGEPTIASTSTFVVASWQAHARLGFSGGLDTRRRVRFLRDRDTPETDFDDSYRQGYWLGFRSRPLSWLDFDVDGRTRLRSDVERADSGTMRLGFRFSRWWDLRLTSRSTLYRSELVEGWLQSGRLSVQPHPRMTLGVFGGARQETGRINDLIDGTDPWAGADMDLSLGRNAWISLTWESQLDGEESFDQLWIGTGLRF